MLTQFGYEVDGLPDILTAAEVADLTGSNATQAQLSAGLAAAQAAVRGYCGWHVAPSVDCTFETECQGFPEIQLPAAFVERVDSVSVGGASVQFQAKHTGRVRRADGKPWPESWGSVRVRYTAGVGDSQLKQIVAKLAAACVASPAGVRSESIGSASVTYSSTECELTPNMRAVLDAYRLKARP